jgi:hypothetical protein
MRYKLRKVKKIPHLRTLSRAASVLLNTSLKVTVLLRKKDAVRRKLAVLKKSPTSRTILPFAGWYINSSFKSH